MSENRALLACAVFLLLVFNSFPHASAASEFSWKGDSAVSFSIKTSAFSDGGSIPKQYTCDGADVSPALSWSGAPSGTQSFALIADDPDAPVGTWTHWVIWDIPAQATGLPEGVPKNESLSDGSRQGKNDFKRIGYGGPCPPPGKPHRYFFKLYALGSKLDLKAGASKAELERAMSGHVLVEAKLMGKYAR
ncbi:MAG TPA: YbhB/YbcL family Raf kinase inhibitor-like protein [Candidatus Acidoferrales bacterium]|nr:YbhB/YbcL family Raf kinase inhibitor-like protein [Candidatus Acidoferrales bacterium]